MIKFIWEFHLTNEDKFKQMKEQQLNLFGEVVEPDINDSILIKTKNISSKSLSKEQKLFNRLVKKIEKLTITIENKEQLLEDILFRYHNIMRPVKVNIAQSLIELAKRIHDLLEKYQYTNTQQRELSAMLVGFLDNAFGLIEPDEELIKLYDQHSFEGNFKEIEEENLASELDDMIEMLEMQFGIKLDRNTIPNPQTASQEDMAAFFASLHEKIEVEQSGTKDKKPLDMEKKRKMTKAQQQKMLKEKAAEELKNKSIRSLYLTLAKALHPDTGGTKEEVIRKEELMKQVTQAYENKDLSSLLKLEIVWLKGEAGATDEIGDKQLGVYNQVLKDQVKELEKRQYGMAANPRFFEISEYCFAEAKDIPVMFDEELEGLSVRLKEIEGDLDKISNKKSLIEFLEAVKESVMQSVIKGNSFSLLDSLLEDEEMSDFF